MGGLSITVPIQGMIPKGSYACECEPNALMVYAGGSHFWN